MGETLVPLNGGSELLHVVCKQGKKEPSRRALCLSGSLQGRDGMFKLG